MYWNGMLKLYFYFLQLPEIHIVEKNDKYKIFEE